MTHTAPFSELNKGSVDKAGGKGASLGEMTQAGIPVPPGFVVLADAFERFIEETDINVEIDNILHEVDPQVMHTVENASEQIQGLIKEREMPDDLREEILSEFDKLGADFVAVRSSATAEDSSSDAWAGQLDSFLNTNRDTLLENVRNCWASLFTPRAIFYRFERFGDDTHTRKVSVAVVVQKMVNSECSGIAFSVHPVTQDYNQFIIEAGFGLGEAIVSGSVTPDSYVVEKKPRRIIDVNISTQTRGLYRVDDGGNEWKDISEPVASSQVLVEDQVTELSELILRVEDHYGFPCDIEWAFENGEFYIVQSRPITTLTAGQPELQKTIDSIKKHDFTLRSQYPMFPAAYFGPPANRYVDNPYLQNGEGPGLIFMLNEGVDVWIDETKKVIVKDTETIKKISNDCLESYRELKEYIEKNKVDDFLELDTFKELIGKITILYKPYSFFADENFETNDEQLLKGLPEIRLEVSEFVVNDVFPLLYKILTKASEKHSIPEDVITKATPLEIEDILSGKQVDIDKDRKIAIVFANGEVSYVTDQEEFTEIENYLKEQNKPGTENASSISGVSATAGKVSGKVIVLSALDYGNAGKVLGGQKDYVLVTPMTRPEIVQYMKNASAFVTDEGGITCHAAIVAREMQKPCIIGTKHATQILKDGDEVEVDADKGVVRKISKN
ncbi:MAG: PEP/pyruvate-binding domain-containing protein [Candidatus Paceibacterota bacterium]